MSDLQARPQDINQSLQSVGIVGVGLIGGSIAAGLKSRGYRGRVIGCGRSASRLEAALQSGLVDSVSTELSHTAAECDLLLFCTPVDKIAEGVLNAAAFCRQGALISDAGSIKGDICRNLAGRLPAGVTFIGSHPLAGSERRGFEHADADLFNGRTCVVTPDEHTPPDQLERLLNFWTSLGMTVVTRSADEHDAALSETSHLPHVVAAALASTLSVSNRPLAASGFRDATRIAAGDPQLWVPILLGNAQESVQAIDRFDRNVADLRDAIVQQDAAKLERLLEAAKRNREGING